MSNSHDYITLPKGYTAFVFGIATAGWMQQVIVNHETTGGKPISSCTFQGLAAPMVITAGGSGFVDQQAYVVTDNTDETQLEIDFSVFKYQTEARGEATSISEYKKDKYNSTVVPWVTTYIYRTEDGGDHDDHDTTFVVTVVKNTKDVPPVPSGSPGGSDSDLPDLPDGDRWHKLRHGNDDCWGTGERCKDGHFGPPPFVS